MSSDNMSDKCALCGHARSHHHVSTTACPEHEPGDLPERWSRLRAFVVRRSAAPDSSPPRAALPHDDASRKALPIFDVLTKYFPRAVLELVKVCVVGNEQHNPGEPLHWARGKSMDQMNSIQRHLMDYGLGKRVENDPATTRWKDGRGPSVRTLVLAHVIWRACAQLELDLEAESAAEAPPKVSAATMIENPKRADLAKLVHCSAGQTANEAWNTARAWCEAPKATENVIGRWRELCDLLGLKLREVGPSVIRDAFMQAWG